MAGFTDRLGEALGNAVDRKLNREIRKKKLPNHVACIMDGNRRHALQKLIPVALGHKMGKEKLEDVMDWILEFKIKYLTVYALSTENLSSRSEEELEELFNLYVLGLEELVDDKRIHENRVKISVIGRRELLPKRVNDSIDNAEKVTNNYEQYVFTICLAYGSREEIVEAIREIATLHASGDLSLEDIDEREVSNRLYTKGMPDPDLIIRTSGEERISNFLLWQSAYSEFIFVDTFWPSFSKREFLRALQTYQTRTRRFGE
ncbi:MAG: di-trans,poly-cis-decaprenylcistransferase [Methanobacteriota archaeon]|nr:MAG: di-trans,poly-cis-decaprenylcistransferase [Euryarchaeota archaeon]|tara:strand:+ start:9741 stop:10523 length:783 start_codon:yes stop_codon:yes gene_type:complete